MKNMKIAYDSKADAIYIEFRKLEPGTAENRQLSDEVIADFGPDGGLAGLEIIDASKILGEDLQKVILELAPAEYQKSA